MLSQLDRVIGVGRTADTAGIAVELIAIEVRRAGASQLERYGAVDEPTLVPLLDSPTLEPAGWRLTADAR